MKISLAAFLIIIIITLYSCSTFKDGTYTVKTSRYRCGKSIVTLKEIGGEWVIDGRIKKLDTLTIKSK